MIELFGKKFANGKNHWLTHILDDCENHDCHLETMSTYEFENCHSGYVAHIKSGNLPVEQITYVHFLMYLCSIQIQ